MQLIRFGNTQTPPPVSQQGVGNLPEINSVPGNIFIVSGPSGSGKGTVINALFQDPEIQRSFAQIQSVKTRPPRPGEVGSADSKSITREAFEALRDENKLFQWTTYNGNYYGSLASEVLGKLRNGTNLLFEMTAQCALALKAAYPNKITTIFNAPPPPEMEVLRQRLNGRGTDSAESIENRIQAAAEEMALKPQFDKVVVNDKLPKAIADLKAIVTRASVQFGQFFKSAA
ncbi:MAG: guanylate kinase [Cyanobacteria bacterium]|nr:guanylate kinase [Cyanobacteriota bacterium]